MKPSELYQRPNLLGKDILIRDFDEDFMMTQRKG